MNRPSILGGAEENWQILVDAQSMMKLKEYLAQESKTSVGSCPEHFGFGTGDMVLLVTKENISEKQLQGWLDGFQP